MATFDYNPITGNLDLVGSGASYIDGVVADPTALPVTVGTPPLDSVYLAKAGSGVWLINRKPAGLYCRVANNGNAADWTYLGAFPEVNADGNWELYNSTDPTKELKFDLSGLPTATTRTVNAPDGNGKMLVEGQSIGATTRASGAFTTLTANNGTLTASAPVLSLSQTWNNAAGSFTMAELRTSVTAGNGYLFRIFAGSSGTTERFRVAADGETNVGGPSLTVAGPSGGIGSPNFSIGNQNQWRSGSNGALVWTDTANNAYAGTSDLFVLRDAAGTLAQRNAANAQTFRLYSTFSSTTSFERLNLIAQTSGSFIIGTEKGSGGGTARGLELRTDNTARLTFGASGTITLNTTLAADAQNISTDTTTGTKIGTGTTQKIGFFNATPVVQPTAVADATDAATVITQLNALLSRMRDLGLIAT